MLTCQKAEFSLPADVHYLNCAYMAPLPRRVEAAGIAGMQRKRVPSAIAPADFFAGADRVRARFARLIGANDPARIAIVPSVSYGLAVVARNTPVGSGRNVVVSEEQFPSNVYAWRSALARSGGELRVIAPLGFTARQLAAHRAPRLQRQRGHGGAAGGADRARALSSRTVSMPQRRHRDRRTLDDAFDCPSTYGIT